MSTFTAVTVLDGSVETPIIQEFEYMGQTWVVHNSIKVYTEHFRVSHKETGRALRDYRNGSPTLFDTVDRAIELSKALMDHVGQKSIDHWLNLVHTGQV